MDISKEEKRIQRNAIEYIKKNRQKFIKEFILSKKVFPEPVITVFMAGFPGVGKTEYVDNYEKRQNKLFNEKIKQKTEIRRAFNVEKYERLFVRLDIDQIREFIPQYQKTDEGNKVKGNAHIIQPAANIALDLLRDYCVKQKYSFLLDGTFGNQFSTFDSIIKKLIGQNRLILIFFIYAHPIVAWEFTKKREFLEGRNITKDNFIKQYFKSIDNVRRAEKKFNEKIVLSLIIKDRKNEVREGYFDKSYKEIEKILKSCYPIDEFTEEYLRKNLN